MKPIVVIIDDSPSNITLLRAYLGQDFAVRFATDGEAGIAVVRKEKPDLVLLDINMPGLDGYEVCGRLKGDPETRDIPVIFVTAQNEVADEAQGLALGAVDYITKPVTPAIVRARAKVHVELKRFREQKVQELADRLSLATKAAGIGVWDYDIASGRLICNAEMARLYATAPDAPFQDFAEWLTRIHPDDAARVDAERRRLLAGESPYKSEFRILLPTGEIRTMKGMGTVFADDGGRPARVLGTNWDITEQRQLITDLEAARAEAEAASEAKGRFIAVATHELRTPLNAINGFGTMLLETEDRPDRRKQLQFVCDAGSALEALTNDILEYVRIEEDETAAEVSLFNPSSELAAIVGQFQAPAADKGLALALAVDPDLPVKLLGPLNMVRLVLARLIGNGVKFTGAGGLTVAAEAVAAEAVGPGALGPGAGANTVTVLFSVRDTGPGIRSEHLEKIFDLFEQEDSAAGRRFEGLGLGLTLARRLVAQMGGTLWAESELGVGSSFFFTAAFDLPDGPDKDVANFSR